MDVLFGPTPETAEHANAWDGWVRMAEGLGHQIVNRYSQITLQSVVSEELGTQRSLFTISDRLEI